MKLTSLCVYCGSSPGKDPLFMETAEAFGQLMAKAGIRLVYGGGNVGIMGALARSVMAHGGHVTGIIPQFLTAIEIGNRDADELIVTESMHIRKQLMFDKSQGFVALPGGIGTVEETIEMLTWAQLGRHNYPIILANINGFWDPLIELLDHIIKSGFARSDIRRIYAVVDRVEDIIPRIEASL